MSTSEQLAWLVTMAQTPGWRDYALDKAKRMAKAPTHLWDGIDSELARILAEVATESDPPCATKPLLAMRK